MFSTALYLAQFSKAVLGMFSESFFLYDAQSTSCSWKCPLGGFDYFSPGAGIQGYHIPLEVPFFEVMQRVRFKL